MNDILPYKTQSEREQLILSDYTKQQLLVDPDTLGRHSNIQIYFKCVVCHQPHLLSKKRILDGKGLTHPGQCRTIVRQRGGKQARENEDPKYKEIRKQKLNEKFAKDKDSIIQNRKATLIEKYGTDKLSEIPQIRNNISSGVSKAYNEKYKEILQRRKQTNLEKYQSTNFLTSANGKELAINSNQERFGVNYPFQNKQFQQQAREIYTNTSGFANPQQDPNTKIKTEKTNIKTGLIKTLSTGERISDICTKNQIKHSNGFKVFREMGEQVFLQYVKDGPKTSSLELQFMQLFSDQFPQLKHFNQKPIENTVLSYKPDFKLTHNDKTIYVNVDGLYWHSECEKSDNYHFELREKFENHNLQILQFRENEIRDKPEIVKSIVFSNLGIFKTKIDGRKCIIKQVDNQDSKQFFEQNHLMGHICARTFGLYHQDVLVCAISIKRKDEGIEIARFGSKIDHCVRGGFSKLLNYVIKQCNPKFVVSFCDFRYATGKSYNKLQFKLEKITQGWEWTDFTNTFNRLKCRANMDDRKLTQQQHADELGWHKIFDAGQAKYILYL